MPLIPVHIETCEYVSATGTFVADVDYSGGNSYSTTSAVDTSLLAATVPQAMLQTERYGEFTYTVPGFTAGSTALVTLYFSESYWSAAGQRTFNVAINGTTALSAFDIYAAAGGQNKAIARSFDTTANSSGQVVIAFTKGGGPDNPKVTGIVVAAGGTNPPPTYTLTVSKGGTGNGLVTGSGINCGTACSASVTGGTSVTLSATADSGSTFAGWGGACSGTASCVVTVNAALAHWYSYGFVTHLLRPNGHVFMVKTRGGARAKVEFLSYYCPGSQPGCLTFRWAWTRRPGTQTPNPLR